MILEVFPKITRQPGGTGTLTTYWGEFTNFRVNAALIDKCNTKQTIKVKAKNGETGTEGYVPFRYRLLDKNEDKEATAEGISLEANESGVLLFLTADSLAGYEYDRAAAELTPEEGGTIGTVYLIQSQPRYTESE